MQSDINLNQLVPGTVIAIRYPLYKHFAIISDRIYDDLPMLISLSYRTNSVEEEPWPIVTGGRTVEPSNIKGAYSKEIVLSRARNCIDKDIKYELFSFNCEHFVRYAHGLPMESIQVKQALSGAVIGAASSLLLAKFTVARFTILATIGAVTSLKNLCIKYNLIFYRNCIDIPSMCVK